MADELTEESLPGEEQRDDPEGTGEGEQALTEKPAPAEEVLEKSAEEIAAEEAMLAELESMDAEEEEEGEPEPVGEIEHPEPVQIEQARNLELLMDVSLQITAELGRKEMRFGDVLQLGKGSLVELNKVADEPVDIYVNQSKIAEGEVVVVDDHFGVRITKLLNVETLKRIG
ncbi:MAG: flagellar motor switch protein FliN [bacterium]